MWDKKGENLTFDWLKNLQNSLLQEQDFLGSRLSTAQLQKLSDEDLAKYAVSRAEKCNAMGYMSFGNTNKEKVKRLQQALKKVGANIEDSEGTFGESTLKSVIAAQKKVGIRTDGCVGPETLSALGFSLSDSGMKVDIPQEPMQGAVDGQAEVPIAEYTGKITPSKRQRSLDKITSIVLHDTLTSSLRGMIGAFSKPRTYTAKSGEEKTYYTGTHFSITADGKVRQHAPLSLPTNHTATGGWNSKSVGIDIVTRAGGTGAGYKGYMPPTPAQMEALYVLASQLASKLPSLDKTVHWMSDAPRGGWKLGGKIFNIPSGIVSHGMVQGNRSDATFSSHYLKLRTQGMGHAEAFNKTREAEQVARLGQRTMVAENSFEYGENLTYKFLKLLKEQSAGKRALIIGDSQGASNATGGALASILSNAGYKVVNKSKYGSFTAQAEGQIPDKKFDLVVLFTGGHFKSRPADAIKIAKMFPNTTKFIISGPPPVQRIKDISGSVRKFPYLRSVPKENLETYFVNPQDKRSRGIFQGRERRNNAFKQAASSVGLSYIDPRSVFGVTNPADFPVVSNSDGIHMYGNVASQMATAIAGAIDQQLKADPSQAQKPSRSKMIIDSAKTRSQRCLRNNILAFGAGMGRYKDMKGRVEALQQALVDKKLTKNPKNFVDGKFGTKTLIAVLGSQILNDIKPDGCSGPETLAALGVKEAPSVEKAIATTTAGMEEKEFAKKYNLDPNILAAFVAMESGGKGFAPVDPDDPEKGKRMLIRFEPHVFVRLIMKKGIDPNNVPYYIAPPKNNQEAEKLAKEFSVPEAKVKQLVGLPLKRAIRYGVWSLIQRKNASRKGFRKSGQGVARLNFREWEGLNNALKIDEDAAYKSISMGTGQVMGFNHRKLGYSTAEDMFNALNDQSDTGKLKQKEAKLKFIENSPRLIRAIREKQWEMIGKLYNGSRRYGKKLEKVYNRMVA